MDLTKLKKLVAEIPAPYQDVIVNGLVIAKGSRDTCLARWEMIKPHLKDGITVVDVGSDLGYFATRIAKEFPKSNVLSIEQNERSCNVQKELCLVQKLYNIAVCNIKIWTDNFKRISLSVEAIDTMLIFAVLHYHTEKEQTEVLKTLSKFVPNLIIEYVMITGPGAFGGTAYPDIQETIKPFYKNVEVIGKTQMGPSETRIMIKAGNSKIVREGLFSTCPKNVNKISSCPNHKLEYDEGKWILKSKISSGKNEYPKIHDNFIGGFSAHNLLLMGNVWPDPNWWKKEAIKAYNRLIAEGKEVTDIHPPNLIFSAGCLKVIDWSHSGAPFNKEKAVQDINAAGIIFERMSYV